jgi:hypothetical protein
VAGRSPSLLLVVALVIAADGLVAIDAAPVAGRA